jgi:hypothetical protein
MCIPLTSFAEPRELHVTHLVFGSKGSNETYRAE